jgi:hypothetical protein
MTGIVNIEPKPRVKFASPNTEMKQQAPADDYSIRVLDEDGIEEVCALFRTVFRTEISQATWRWKYYDSLLDGHINVVLMHGPRVVGHAGAVILPGMLDGKRFPFAQVCDVMLDPDARGGAGPRGAYATFMNGLIAALQAKIPEGMYYGFPGERPFRLGERLGFYRGTGRIFEYACPTNVRAPPLWGLFTMNWTDPRIDDLWLRHAPRSGCRLVKDHRYLSWRYAKNPTRRYQLLEIRFGRFLLGWTVVHRRDRVVEVIDRLIDERWVKPAIQTLANWAGGEGAERVTWWQGEKSARLPADATATDTTMIGVVMPSSAARFSACSPNWQPGDTDVR